MILYNLWPQSTTVEELALLFLRTVGGANFAHKSTWQFVRSCFSIVVDWCFSSSSRLSSSELRVVVVVPSCTLEPDRLAGFDSRITPLPSNRPRAASSAAVAVLLLLLQSSAPEEAVCPVATGVLVLLLVFTLQADWTTRLPLLLVADIETNPVFVAGVALLLQCCYWIAFWHLVLALCLWQG